MAWILTQSLHENTIVEPGKKRLACRSTIHLIIRLLLVEDLIMFIKTFSLNPQLLDGRSEDDEKKYAELKFIFDCLLTKKIKLDRESIDTMKKYFNATKNCIPGSKSMSKLYQFTSTMSAASNHDYSLTLDLFLVYYLAYVLSRVTLEDDPGGKSILGKYLFERGDSKKDGWSLRNKYGFGDTIDTQMPAPLNDWEDFSLSNDILSMNELGSLMFRMVYSPSDQATDPNNQRLARNMSSVNLNFGEQPKRPGFKKKSHNTTRKRKAAEPIQREEKIQELEAQLAAVRAALPPTLQPQPTQQSNALQPRPSQQSNVMCNEQTQVSRVATFRMRTFIIVLLQGSITDFYYAPNPMASAIVNAANEGCIGGKGVDGAISSAGGCNLLADRQALPLLGPGIRCKTGSAVITGPNSYGKLHSPFVIHAVGPDLRKCAFHEGVYVLSSAYINAMNRAAEYCLEAVAFCPLSAGIFRGTSDLKPVLALGLDAISQYDGHSGLKEVHFFAYTEKECDMLLEIANEMGLVNIETGSQYAVPTQKQGDVEQSDNESIAQRDIFTSPHAVDDNNSQFDNESIDIDQRDNEDVHEQALSSTHAEDNSNGQADNDSIQSQWDEYVGDELEDDITLDLSDDGTANITTITNQETVTNNTKDNTDNNNESLGNDADDANIQIITRLKELVGNLDGNGSMLDRILIVQSKNLIDQLHSNMIGNHIGMSMFLCFPITQSIYTHF